MGSFPPSVITNSASGIATGSATLNGDLRFLGSATTVNVSFEWGTTQGGPYTNKTPTRATAAAGAFHADISSLSPYTVYYFRAKAEGGIYVASHGQEMSFITSSVPPSVATGNATSITMNTARLNGNLSSLGSAALVNVSFQWGTSHASYTHETAAQTMTVAGSFWADLAELSQGTTYYFRARAVGDSTTVYGDEQTFTTSSPAPPPTPPPAPTPHSSAQVTSPTPSVMPMQLPNIVVQAASLSARNTFPGVPVQVIATVTNRGSARGQAAVKLYINGLEKESRSITLDAGASASMAYSVKQDEPGDYTVYVGGIYAGSFKVAQDTASDIILISSSSLVVAALVLACVYIWRRRQQGY